MPARDCSSFGSRFGVAVVWRNGPIENVHAGRYVGYGLNERRVLPKAEKSIIRHAQDGLFSGLKAADYLKYDGA